MKSSVYSQVDHNKRVTLYLIAFFVLFISGISYFFALIQGSDLAGIYVLIAVLFSILTSIFSYYYSDSIVLKISGAKELTYDMHPQIHMLVENMAIASGLPKPRIYYIDDTAMNAFATGRDPEHAVICFTKGILNRLDKRELEGVIAHEMAHIKNYDIRLMTVVSVLVGTVVLLSDWLNRGIFYGRRRDDSKIPGFIIAISILFIALSPLIATLIQLAISRNREYLADASAVMLTRYPPGLINALKKLGSDNEVLEAANGATAHMYIVNPLKGRVLANLFNTHPPIEERIKRLELM